jgi:SAM-dependent methyltransferase
VLLVYLLAIFLSAALLFLVQPMAAKLVLPILGGSPSVWNTTMVFFQALLLLGYFYSHLVTKKLPRLAQGVVHAGVIVAGALMLPIALPKVVGTPGAGDSPTLWLLMLLPLVAGVPFFVLTTTGPLLQSWFASSSHRRAKDPYFLYAASNIGSFVGLLCFPFFLEPRFDLAEQSAWFSRGYYAFAALAALCFLFAWRGGAGTIAPSASVPPAAPITWPTRLLWIALAAVPSSLSLSVAHAITTDIAPVPLLWVLPLSIYLLTFVVAFSSRIRVRPEFAGVLLLPVALSLLEVRFAGTALPNELVFAVHLLLLAVGALMCHTRLAASRPAATGLTEFYLWLAVGGVAGGLFNAMLAPKLFNAALEYPVAVAAACCLIPSRHAATDRRSLLYSVLAALAIPTLAVVAVQWLEARGAIGPAAVPVSKFLALIAACVLVAIPPRGRFIRFGLAVMVAFVYSMLSARQQGGALLYVERTFFGIHEVYQSGDRTRLVHGSTTHGMQSDREELRRTPLSYYHPDGPLGDAMRRAQVEGRSADIAIVGLGVGTTAAYSRSGDRFTFFEIDPAVVGIARDPGLFTYLADAQGTIDIVLGDGRASLARESRRFDLITLDAFSSDAVPLHLLTREAIATYRQRLKPGGAIAFHVSSRYLALGPIISATVAATNAGSDPDPMVVVSRDDLLTRDEGASTGRYPSTWLLAMRRSEAAAMVAAFSESPNPARHWRAIPVPRMKPWTDAYSSIWSALVPAFAKDALEAAEASAPPAPK